MSPTTRSHWGEFEFEWDDDKARVNLVSHGVSFGEAQTCFGDLLGFDRSDQAHSTDEDRWILVARSGRDPLWPPRTLSEAGSFASSPPGPRLRGNAMTIKDRRADPDIDDDYDFSKAIPNPYAARFAKGHRTRISRNLEGSRLGIAVAASCDGKELRVHLSNGDEIRSTLIQYTLLDEAEPETPARRPAPRRWSAALLAPPRRRYERLDADRRLRGGLHRFR